MDIIHIGIYIFSSHTPKISSQETLFPLTKKEKKIKGSLAFLFSQDLKLKLKRENPKPAS